MTYQAKAAAKAEQMLTTCMQALTIPKRTNWSTHNSNEAYVNTCQSAKGPAWEAVIDCLIPKCSVGVIVRRYWDNTMRTQWECGFGRISKAEAIERMAEALERNDNDMEGAPRPQQQPSIEQVAREGFKTTPDTTYEEWDAMRRTLLAKVDGYDEVEVRHGQYESTLFHGTDGRVVASWYPATGTCSVHTPDTIAEYIADDVRNYIRNAMRYSTSTISDLS